jgi:hypothetical protein
MVIDRASMTSVRDMSPVSQIPTISVNKIAFHCKGISGDRAIWRRSVQPAPEPAKRNHP